MISEVTKFFFFVIVLFGLHMSPHHSDQVSHRSHISCVVPGYVSISKCLCLFVDQVMSAHHSDQMSQES